MCRHTSFLNWPSSCMSLRATACRSTHCHTIGAPCRKGIVPRMTTHVFDCDLCKRTEVPCAGCLVWCRWPPARWRSGCCISAGPLSREAVSVVWQGTCEGIMMPDPELGPHPCPGCSPMPTCDRKPNLPPVAPVWILVWTLALALAPFCRT